MPRTAALVVLLATAALTAACATGCSSTSSTAASSGTVSAPASASRTPDPFPAPQYPTAADTDTAFVSEVAALDSVKAWLTRTEPLSPSNVTADAAQLAQLGRQACADYTGGDPTPVAESIVSAVHADPIDATAFLVAAAGDYCPQRLVDLGQGVAMRDGVRVEPVTPRCPTQLPVTVAVSPITLSGQSNTEAYGDFGADNSLVYGNTDGLYDGSWSYTLTNSSDFDAIVSLQQRVHSTRYTTDWTPPGDITSPQGALYVPAHQSVTENSTMSGAYAWKSAEYQVTGWLPVSCEVSLR